MDALHFGKKTRKRPLYKEQTLYLEEMKLMELMLINHAHVKLYNSQEGKELINKTNTYGCCIERCNNTIDFLLLMKHDFIGEPILKKNMFGRVFENHDCPELTKVFLNVITLLQTFNDDFTFVRGDENVVPLGKLATSYSTM